MYKYNFIVRLSKFVALFFMLAAMPNAYGQSSTQTDNAAIRVQVTSDQQMEIISRISGQIKSINFLDGESFKKNDTLITFDCRELTAKLKQAKSRVKLHTEKYKSYEELYNLGGASKIELGMLQATAEEEKANHELAKLHVEYCNIKAPFSGIVSQLDVKTFQVVSDKNPLMFITNNEEVQLEMFIPSGWLNKLEVGASFIFQVDDLGQNLQAEIKRIGGRYDPVTQTVKIYGIVKEETTNLRVGMTGTAIFDIK